MKKGVVSKNNSVVKWYRFASGKVVRLLTLPLYHSTTLPRRCPYTTLPRLLLALSLVLGNSALTFAKGPGTDSAQYLKLGTGARPIAMGEAFVAVADDANAVLWNTGGLGFLKQKEFSAMHMEYLENIRLSGLSYVHPTHMWGTFAANLSYLYTNSIERTVLRNDIAEGFEKKGSFGVSAKTAILTYGRVVSGNKDNETQTLGVGMGVRFIQETLDSYNASAFAVDFGALYKYSHRIRFGFSLQNLGSRLKFVRENESLPLVVRAGVGGTEFKDRLNYSLELYSPRDSGMEIHSGAEFWIKRLLAPRVGWRFRNLYRDNTLNTISAITGGIGLRLFNYQVDYGFVPFGEVGNSHRISITGRF